MPPLKRYKPTAVERERRRRIRVAIAAYAYEYANDPIMTDDEYDELAYSLNVHMDTGNDTMDRFFRRHFDPHTGMWIRKHPELKRIAELYRRHWRN